MSETEVVQISATDTHPLRRSVLRFDTPTKEVVFPEDEWPESWHLGLRVDGSLVATSSWVPREHDGRPGVQLRGMATDRSLQGTGWAGCCWKPAASGRRRWVSRMVWARARDTALAFYVRHGFQVTGDGFIDEATQLPHHVVVRRLE